VYPHCNGVAHLYLSFFFVVAAWAALLKSANSKNYKKLKVGFETLNLNTPSMRGLFAEEDGEDKDEEDNDEEKVPSKASKKATEKNIPVNSSRKRKKKGDGDTSRKSKHHKAPTTKKG
jgi:hypothetical protein